MRQRGALVVGLALAVALVLGACGDDGPKPTGFVTDDQVKASDAGATTTTASGATADASTAGFCGAWTTLQALDEKPSGDAKTAFETMVTAFSDVDTAAPPDLRPEVDTLTGRLDQLRTIGERYHWTFDDSTTPSAEDVATITALGDEVARFFAASTIARKAFEQCGGEDPSFTLPCGSRRSFHAVGSAIGQTTTTAAPTTDPDEVGAAAVKRVPGAKSYKVRKKDADTIEVAVLDGNGVALHLIQLKAGVTTDYEC